MSSMEPTRSTEDTRHTADGGDWWTSFGSDEQRGGTSARGGDWDDHASPYGDQGDADEHGETYASGAYDHGAYDHDLDRHQHHGTAGEAPVPTAARGVNFDYRALFMGLGVTSVFWGLAIATYALMRMAVMGQSIAGSGPIKDVVRSIETTAGGGLVLFSAFGAELDGGVAGTGLLGSVDLGGYAAFPPTTFLPIIIAANFLALHIIQGRHPAHTWGAVISRVIAFTAGSTVVLYFAAHMTTTDQTISNAVAPFTLWFDLRVLPSILTAAAIIAVTALFYFFWVGSPRRYSAASGFIPTAMRAHVHAATVFTLVAGIGGVVVLAASSMTAENAIGFIVGGFTLGMVLPAAAFGVPFTFQTSAEGSAAVNVFGSSQVILLILVIGGIVLAALQFVFSAKRPCRFVPDVTIGAIAGLLIGYAAFTLCQATFALAGSGLNLAQMVISDVPDTVVLGSNVYFGALAYGVIGAAIPALAYAFATMLGRTRRQGAL